MARGEHIDGLEIAELNTGDLAPEFELPNWDGGLVLHCRNRRQKARVIPNGSRRPEGSKPAEIQYSTARGSSLRSG